MSLYSWARGAWVRWLSIELGAGIIALAELVTVLPALILIRLGGGVPEAFSLALGGSVVAYLLGRRAMGLPLELWRARGSADV